VILRVRVVCRDTGQEHVAVAVANVGAPVLLVDGVPVDWTRYRAIGNVEVLTA
jgi:hypothetical protein